MKGGKKNLVGLLKSDSFLLCAILVIYLAGAFLMSPIDIEKLKDQGVADQKEYFYYDSEGNDSESVLLIEIRGIGYVFTYREIYLSSIPLFFITVR